MAQMQFKTLREEVMDAIRMKILTGELKPGTRMVEKDIAAELGVSRGPVRESLRQLEQEGLVEYTRNVGCSVRQIDERDMYEIYLLRAAYEILAVKLCAGQFPQETYDVMAQALDRMEHLEEGRFCDCMGCDNDFHASIVRMPELPRLYTAWEALSGGSIAACDAGGADRLAVVRRQYPVHRQLYDICRTGKMQAVCDAIMEHYMGTVRRCLSERGLPQPSFHLAADLHL